MEVSDVLISRIEKNKKFREALDNPQARQAMIAMLMEVIGELEESIPEKVES